jgi:predicted nucleic acid-binding protein
VILVDSNILIDVLEPDPVWAEWSNLQLAAATRDHRVCVTPIVVAEVGPRYGALATFHELLADFSIGVERLTDEAAFAAGQAFRRYRQVREGPKSILADFLIGGQAQVSGATILTRDAAIYATYFPDVPLIRPDKGKK